MSSATSGTAVWRVERLGWDSKPWVLVPKLPHISCKTLGMDGVAGLYLWSPSIASLLWFMILWQVEHRWWQNLSIAPFLVKMQWEQSNCFIRMSLFFMTFAPNALLSSWLGFWGHRLGYDIQMRLTTGNRRCGSQKLWSSLTHSSCWGFDLMNLFPYNKSLRLLLPLSLFLCLCPKSGQRMCSRNWSLPCPQGARLLGVTLRKGPPVRGSVVPSPL